MDDTTKAVDWADVVAAAYAAEAKPPLTDELIERVRETLARALASGADPTAAVDRLNGALDDFEVDLGSVVGPRVASLDAAAGSAAMKHRSEAGQPLRAFGGQ